MVVTILSEVAFYHRKPASAGSGASWLRPSSGCSAASKGCVTGKAAGQDVSCGLELLADETQAEEPGAHCVFGVFGLLGLGAGRPYHLGHLAEGQAKLNVAFQLSGVEAVALAVRRLVKLEKPELNRTLGEGGVEVEHMVAAVIVVLASTVVGVLASVPNVCELRHGAGLFAVELVQEPLVNCAAVAVHPSPVEVQRACQKHLVACYDVGQVAEGLRGVTLGTNVDVNPAASGGVALGSCLAKAADQLLQGFHVGVSQDRGDQFAFLVVGSRDADVSLEFPFPTLGIPSRPGVVAVAACGVFKAPGAKELGCQSGGFVSADAVHLNLDSDGLVFHLCDLPCCFLVHGDSSVFVWCVFPFGVHIFALKEDNSKSISDNILHKENRRILCSLQPISTIRYWFKRAVFLLIEYSESESEACTQSIDKVFFSSHARDSCL